MKTFDVTFEITVNVEAENEESIDMDEAAIKASFEFMGFYSQYVKEIKEYGTAAFPEGVAGFGREDYENVIEELDYPEFSEDQLRKLIEYSWDKWDCSVSMSAWEQLDWIINDFATENDIKKEYKEED
jgi:hypothetical protein